MQDGSTDLINKEIKAPALEHKSGLLNVSVQLSKKASTIHVSSEHPTGVDKIVPTGSRFKKIAL